MSVINKCGKVSALRCHYHIQISAGFLLSELLHRLVPVSTTKTLQWANEVRRAVRLSNQRRCGIESSMMSFLSVMRATVKRGVRQMELSTSNRLSRRESPGDGMSAPRREDGALPWLHLIQKEGERNDDFCTVIH